MARNVFKTVGTVDTTESTDGTDISTLKAGTVAVTVSCSTSAAWSGTWVLDVSNNGTNWAPGPTSKGGVTSTSTADKCWPIDSAFKLVRLRCSSYSSGSATAVLSGESLVD